MKMHVDFFSQVTCIIMSGTHSPTLNFSSLRNCFWKGHNQSIGLMEIPGFAISADIELLRQEIDNYRKSLGITDSIIANLCDDEENPALEAAWELIFYDSGIHSILRQTAMELDPEDLMNFAKKVPLLGGGISFPATCR